MRTRKYALGAVFAAIISLLASCASLPATGTLGGPLVRGGFPSAAELSEYARAGLASLSTFELPNGIPVVVRRNSASAVRHIALVIRGGAAAATPETAGYELLALKTMARGSKRYSYEEITALLDETSAALGPSAQLDFSMYSLTALDKHFERLLPVWADTLVAPRFQAADFDQVLSEAKLALKSKEQDPWQRTGVAVNSEFFTGHPYAASPEGTKVSLSAATLDAVRAWYDGRFGADALFVVAVGDFDPTALKAALSPTIGAIPARGGGAFAQVPAFAADGAGRLVKVEHPQSRGVAYLRGDFAAPSPADPGYMAANIAMKMFADLLFNVVRDEHGAAYSPNAFIRGALANYGSVVIYKTTKGAEVKRYIDEAFDELRAGRCLSVDPEKSDVAMPTATMPRATMPRMPIADALPVYKAQFANEYFEKLQTNAAVAGLIAQSVVTTGDCRSWLLDEARIKAVNAREVEAAVAALSSSRLVWVALGSRDAIEGVDPAAYARLGTR